MTDFITKRPDPVKYEQRCETCEWIVKEYEKSDEKGNVIDIIGTCQYPLPFFIERPEVSMKHDGITCAVWKPKVRGL